MNSILQQINNPLSYILSNLETLLLYLDQMSNIEQQNQKIRSLIEKGSFADAVIEVRKLDQFKKHLMMDYILSDTRSLAMESLRGINQIIEISKRPIS